MQLRGLGWAGASWTPARQAFQAVAAPHFLHQVWFLTGFYLSLLLTVTCESKEKKINVLEFPEIASFCEFCCKPLLQ